MIGNNIIQADLIAAAKASPGIVGVIFDADEVREDQWQGVQFKYPNVRLWLGSQIPIRERGPSCDHTRLPFAFRCYAEDDSSLKADLIATACQARFHHKFFRGTGWYGWLRIVSLISAERVLPRLWRAAAEFETFVYPDVGGTGL